MTCRSTWAPSGLYDVSQDDLLWCPQGPLMLRVGAGLLEFHYDSTMGLWDMIIFALEDILCPTY